MAFQSGHGKIGGRSKGTPNKKTLARIKSITRILTICEDELEADVHKLSPAERIRLWKALAGYTLPKFASAHIELEQPEPQKLHITREIVSRCIPDDELEEFQEAGRNGRDFEGGIITDRYMEGER